MGTLSRSISGRVKFLTDTQTPRPFSDALEVLGWDVHTVYRYGLQFEKDDTKILQKATELGRVMITFDDLRGQQGVSIARELRDNGGRLLRIAGGPEQPHPRAVGKFLFHHDRWEPWFLANEGRAVLSDKAQLPRFTLRAAMPVRIQRIDEHQFEGYLDLKEAAKHAPRKSTKRPRKVPIEQRSLDSERARERRKRKEAR